jgi:predicted metallo-beta-lactamase superfamily hydrolase
MLICAEGAKTPAGVRGRGDPAGALAPRRLPVPPAESEAPRDRQKKPPVTAVIIQGSLSLVEHKSTYQLKTRHISSFFTISQCLNYNTQC